MKNISYGTSLLGFVLAMGFPPAVQSQGDTKVVALEEIVVTARKREESLMETPVSISAFSEAELDLMRVETASDIAANTPNLVFSAGSANTGDSSVGVVFIRGIGQTDYQPTNEPGVGIYLDDVYLSQASGTMFKLIDVESIQVLRGPQGTLFGRNTIGGAVLINSKKPSEEFYGDVEITVGERNRLDYGGKVNIPLTDTVFAKISAMQTTRDGYIDRDLAGGESGDDDTFAARVALRWVPSDALDINLSADYSKSENNGVAAALSSGEKIANAGFAAHHNFVKVPTSTAGAQPFDERWVTDRYSTFGSELRDSNTEIWGVNLLLEWELSDNISLKSITNYRDLKSEGGLDDDNSPERIRHILDATEQDQFSQEIQLSGKAWSDRLNWLVGYYYFEEDAININEVAFSPVGVMSGAIVDNESEALFAQATLEVTEKFNVTLGLRHTEEEKTGIVDDRIQWLTSRYDADIGDYIFLPPNAAKLVPNGSAKNDEEETDPYLNLAYHWNDSLMTYISYSEGFKGGGFVQRNVAPAPELPSFGPEFATVYEIGFKMSALDNRLNLTGALYHTDYEDIQVAVETGPLRVNTLTNVGDVEFRGGELEAVALLAEGWKFTAGVGYTNGKYTELSTDALLSGLTLNLELPFVSEWQTNASLTNTRAAFSGELVTRVDWSYRSDFNTLTENVPENEQSGYSLWNASVSYMPASEKWKFTLAAKNLADEYYATNFGAYTSGEGMTTMFVGPPREISASFKYMF
jgi:iron complex outermembrane receptor protein